MDVAGNLWKCLWVLLEIYGNLLSKVYLAG
jgi:hypothetical protein